MEIYLDDGKNIKIDIDCERERPIINEITLREYSKSLSERIYEDILFNLYNSTTLKQHLSDSNKYDVCVGDQEFFEIDMLTKEVKEIHTLRATEVRLLGQAKYTDLMIGKGKFAKPAIVNKEINTDFVITTDLHSHLSAVLSGEDLIEVGSKSNISFPLNLAQDIGLDVNGLIPNEYGKLKLNDILALNPDNIKKLTDNLEICPYTHETFDRMEEIYAARAPFTKNKNILEPILWKIAEKYVKDGIDYVELSSTEVVKDVEFLSKIHEVLPKIEEFWAMKGKKIRIMFLAAIARDSIEEKKNDDIDRIKEIAKISPYIAGIDFLGHESNPVSAIAPQIKEMVEWAANLEWPFVIRVHSGETDIYDNVKDTLKIIKTAYKKARLFNLKAKLPPIRIGHAIYNANTPEVDKLIEDLSKEDNFIGDANVATECARSSNLALDNMMYYNQVFVKSIKKERPILIVTDGPGIYGTTSKAELELARGDLTPKEADIAKQLVSKTETSIKEASLKGFEIRMQNFNKLLFKQLEEEHSGNISSLFKFSYRDGAPAYVGNNKEIVDRRNKENKEKLLEFIRFMLQKADINIVERDNYADFVKKIEGKTPVMIANTALNVSNFSFDEATPKMKEIVEYLIESLDPEKSFFVIGGIKSGAEQYLLQRLHEKRDKKFDVLNFVTEQAVVKMEVMNKYKTITDAIILENNNPLSYFLIPKEVTKFLKEYKGILVASQGGAVMADIITSSFNAGDIALYLSSEDKGTARNKTKIYYDFTQNQNGDLLYVFKTAKQFKELFSQNSGDIMSVVKNRNEQMTH